MSLNKDKESPIDLPLFFEGKVIGSCIYDLKRNVIESIIDDPEFIEFFNKSKERDKGISMGVIE